MNRTWQRTHYLSKKLPYTSLERLVEGTPIAPVAVSLTQADDVKILSLVHWNIHWLHFLKKKPLAWLVCVCWKNKLDVEAIWISVFLLGCTWRLPDFLIFMAQHLYPGSPRKTPPADLGSHSFSWRCGFMMLWENDVVRHQLLDNDWFGEFAGIWCLGSRKQETWLLYGF